MVAITEIVSTAGEAVKLYIEAQTLDTLLKDGLLLVGVGTSSYWFITSWIAPTWRKMTWRPNRNLLQGKVAVVTGASKGVGKGIALGLAEAGAIVYVTGRSESIDQGKPASGTVTETAIQVDGLGGKGIAVVCDHSHDEEVAALFDRVLREQGKIDILVNNVFQQPDIDIAGLFQFFTQY
jgi:hypothetical protein